MNSSQSLSTNNILFSSAKAETPTRGQREQTSAQLGSSERERFEHYLDKEEKSVQDSTVSEHSNSEADRSEKREAVHQPEKEGASVSVEDVEPGRAEVDQARDQTRAMAVAESQPKGATGLNPYSDPAAATTQANGELIDAAVATDAIGSISSSTAIKTTTDQIELPGLADGATLSQQGLNPESNAQSISALNSTSLSSSDLESVSLSEIQHSLDLDDAPDTNLTGLEGTPDLVWMDDTGRKSLDEGALAALKQADRADFASPDEGNQSEAVGDLSDIILDPSRGAKAIPVVDPTAADIADRTTAMDPITAGEMPTMTSYHLAADKAPVAQYAAMNEYQHSRAGGDSAVVARDFRGPAAVETTVLMASKAVTAEGESSASQQQGNSNSDPNSNQQMLNWFGKSATRPSQVNQGVAQFNLPELGSGSIGQPHWQKAVAERIAVMASQRISAAEIQLDPPELGPLQVRVTLNQEQASVTFASQHAVVREALDSTAWRLREMFDAEGFDLVDVDVSDQSFEQAEDQSHRQTDGDATVADEMGDELPVVRVAQGLVDQFV